MNCNIALIDLLNVIRNQDTCIANKVIGEFDESYDNRCALRAGTDCVICREAVDEHINELVEKN